MHGTANLKNHRYIRALALALALGLSGCASQPTPEPQPRADNNVLPADEATVVSYEQSPVSDPLMGFNRAMFAFNDFSYRYVMIPVVKTYSQYTPAPVRTGIANVFANIKSPISIVNHLLQWEPAKAGRTTLRFLMNTTVGIVGIFDPADAWLEIPEETTGFDDTLQDYGTGYGTYVVLPFLGPSDLRNSAGVVADYFLNPIPYLTEQPDTSIIMAGDALQGFSGKAESYEILRGKSDDPYLFFRNMYLQGLKRDQQYGREGENPEGGK